MSPGTDVKPQRSRLPWLAAIKGSVIVVVLACVIVVYSAHRRRETTPSHLPRLSYLVEALNVLDSWGVMPEPEFSLAAVEAAAKRTMLEGGGTGHEDDFGYGIDDPRELLKFLLEDQKSANLTFLGKKARSLHLTSLFSRRLQTMAVREHHGDTIQQMVIHSPVVVTGLPRSGTTAFHRLLSAIPAMRPLLYAEASLPAGIPGTQGLDMGSYGVGEHDPRPQHLRMVMANMEVLGWEVLQRLHKFDPDEGEECSFIMDQSDLGLAAFLAYTPSITGQAARLDVSPPATTAQWLYREMQMIEFLRPSHPEERWLLKAPTHMARLMPMLSIYPDAQLVWMYRDPVQSVGSFCSLMSTLWALHMHPQPHHAHLAGDLGMKLLHSMTVRAMRDFDKMPISTQVLTTFVTYDDFVRKPVEVACDVAVRVGEAVRGDCADPESPVRRALEEFQAAHQRNKFGRHEYSLDIYGLSEKGVRELFAPYTKWVETKLHTQRKAT